MKFSWYGGLSLTLLGVVLSPAAAYSIAPQATRKIDLVLSENAPAAMKFGSEEVRRAVEKLGLEVLTTSKPSPASIRIFLRQRHDPILSGIRAFGVITGRDYFLDHISPTVFLYPSLLWNIHGDPPEIVRGFCRDYFGSDKAAQVFDLLSEADRMVYVERQQLRAERVGDSIFVGMVSRALRLAHELLSSQRDPRMRARAAKLITEVSSRFVSPPNRRAEPEP